MNPGPEELRALLDDVLPSSSEHSGPSSVEVLSMLRSEHRRRRRLRTCAAMLAIIAVTGGALLWNREPAAVTPVAEAPINPAPVVIRRVNDEELFALFQGTPIALAEGPNGNRTLLVIEQSASAR
jgi:hypothetical protein